MTRESFRRKEKLSGERERKSLVYCEKVALLLLLVGLGARARESHFVKTGPTHCAYRLGKRIVRTAFLSYFRKNFRDFPFLTEKGFLEASDKTCSLAKLSSARTKTIKNGEETKATKSWSYICLRETALHMKIHEATQTFRDSVALRTSRRIEIGCTLRKRL